MSLTCTKHAKYIHVPNKVYISAYLLHSRTGEAQESWRLVFLISAIVHLVNVGFFCIFASGEEQDWASGEDEDRGLLPTRDSSGINMT